jgi:hypothetical protein
MFRPTRTPSCGCSQPSELRLRRDRRVFADGLSSVASSSRTRAWSRHTSGAPHPWHRHRRRDDAAAVEAIVPGHGLSGCGPAVGFPARSSTPMPYGSSSAAGDVGVAPTGSPITRAMRPCAARGETSGPRPERKRTVSSLRSSSGCVNRAPAARQPTCPGLQPIVRRRLLLARLRRSPTCRHGLG